MQRVARNAKISRDDVEGQMILRQESAISSREAAQVRLRSRCKVASIFPFRNYLCSFNSERCENAVSNNSTRWCWGAFCVEISCKLLNEYRQTVDIGGETFLNWKSNERTRAHARLSQREKRNTSSRYIRDIRAIFTAVGSMNGIIDYAFLLAGSIFPCNGDFTAVFRGLRWERGSLRLAKRKSSFRAHAGTEALIYSRSLTLLIRWILLYDPGGLENPLDSRFRFIQASFRGIALRTTSRWPSRRVTWASRATWMSSGVKVQDRFALGFPLAAARFWEFSILRVRAPARLRSHSFRMHDSGGFETHPASPSHETPPRCIPWSTRKTRPRHASPPSTGLLGPGPETVRGPRKPAHDRNCVRLG